MINLSLSVKGIENSRIKMQSEEDENELLDNRSDKLKVSTETVITSEDQRHAKSVIEELNTLDKTNGDWIMQYPRSSISEDMNSLPKWNTFGVLAL